jgi:hypothetical protein
VVWQTSVLFDGDVLEEYRCFHVRKVYADKGVVGMYSGGKVASLLRRFRSRCQRRSCRLLVGIGCVVEWAVWRLKRLGGPARCIHNLVEVVLPRRVGGFGWQWPHASAQVSMVCDYEKEVGE